MKNKIIKKILTPENITRLLILSGIVFFLAGFISGYHLSTSNCFYQIRYCQFVRYSYDANSLKIPEELLNDYNNQSIPDLIFIDNETQTKLEVYDIPD